MITWGTYHSTGFCKLTSFTYALHVCAGPALFGTTWHYARVTLPYLFLLHCPALLLWRSPSPGLHFSNINQPIQSPHPNYSPYLAFTLWVIYPSYYLRARAQTAGAPLQHGAPWDHSNYPTLNLYILPPNLSPCMEATVKAVALSFSLSSLPGNWKQCFSVQFLMVQYSPAFGELWVMHCLLNGTNLLICWRYYASNFLLMHYILKHLNKIHFCGKLLKTCFCFKLRSMWV